MITIGQLARYVGVSIKTIRVYHDKRLLPEPDRDASGYRRYGANDAIDLIKSDACVHSCTTPAETIAKLAAMPVSMS